MLLVFNDKVQVMDEPSRPVGLYRNTRPLISEVSLIPGLTAVVYSDGLIHAGDRTGQSMDVASDLSTLIIHPDPNPQWIADQLLDIAVRLDQGRPVDDITVVVLRVSSLIGDEVRRLSVRLPLE